MKYKDFDGKKYPVQLVDGEEVPVIPAMAKEVVKNKRTGQTYKSKIDLCKI